MFRKKVSKFAAYILSFAMMFSVMGTNAYASKEEYPGDTYDETYEDGIVEKRDTAHGMETVSAVAESLETEDREISDSLDEEEDNLPVTGTEGSDGIHDKDPENSDDNHDEDSKSQEDMEDVQAEDNEDADAGISGEDEHYVNESDSESENPDEKDGEPSGETNEEVGVKDEEEETADVSEDELIEETREDVGEETGEDTESDADDEILSERTLKAEVGSEIIEAKGLIPEGAFLIAKEVTAVEEIEESLSSEDDDKSFRVIEAYDIEIVLDGKTWQPVEHDSIVTISLKGMEIPEDDEDIEVYRIEDDDLGITELEAGIDGDTVVFETEHFTVFTIGSSVYETDDATQQWDISKDQDGSVIAYYYESEKKLVIAGSGSIKDYESYGDKSPIRQLQEEEFEVIWSDSIERIGSALFYNCSNAKINSLPEGLREIGSYAFYFCTNASIDVLPSNLKKIERSSFAFCSGVTINSFPSSLTYIGESSFSYCTGVTVSALPVGITEIGQSTFSNCEGITSMEIPEGVISIGESAFESCSNLTEISVPDTVRTIGKKAFYLCTGLKEIKGWNGVEEIGEKAFFMFMSYDDRPISTFIETSSEAVLGYDYVSSNRKAITEIAENDSGYDVSGITPFDISADSDMSVLAYFIEDADGLDKLVIVGKGETFSYRAGNKSPISENLGDKEFELIIGNGITSLGDYLFHNCSNMTLTEIPKGIKTIGDSVFSGCKKIDPLLHEGLESVGAWGFYGCSALSMDTFPESLTHIGKASFAGCSALSLTRIPEGITEIPDSAFLNCTNLAITRIEDQVMAIGASSFRYCENMELEYISENVEVLDMYVFDGCEKIRLSKLPDNLKEIGLGALRDCPLITIESIPEGVTAIEGSAFSNCLGITSINFPESLTSIGHWAFLGCSNLKEITGGNNVSQIETQAFLPMGEYVPGYIELTTRLITTSDVLLNYDWSSDARRLGIKGSFRVILPANINLTFDGENYSCTETLKVETDALQEGDAVYIDMETDGYLIGSKNAMRFSFTQSKNRWIKGDDEECVINVSTGKNARMTSMYEGEINVRISSGKEQ